MLHADKKYRDHGSILGSIPFHVQPVAGIRRIRIDHNLKFQQCVYQILIWYYALMVRVDWETIA